MDQAPAPAGPPAPDGPPGGQIDMAGLHDEAVQAEAHLSKLATGLAHAGANPQAVQQLTGMADKLREVISVLGGNGAQAAQAGPPQGPPGPQGPPPGPPQAGPAGPPPGPPGMPPSPAHQAPPPQAPVPETLATAANHLHKAMVAAAEQRGRQSAAPVR